MKTVLIIHGIGGYPGIHWQNWLAGELKSKGYKVIMPEMPNPDNPDRNQWLSTIKSTVSDLDTKNLVIVGHSLGATTAFDFIEQSTEKMDGVVSVSGFAEDYGADLNGDFLKQKHIDFKIVKNNLNWSSVLYGDDDPYVSQEALKYVADSLDVIPLIIPKGGHLNTETGYVVFPDLLRIITTNNGMIS